MPTKHLLNKWGWNKDNALGKEVQVGKRKRNIKIIGVLKDFYVNGVDKPVEPILFFNYDRNWAKNNMANLQIKLLEMILMELRTHQRILADQSRTWLSLNMNLWINNLPKLLRNSLSKTTNTFQLF